MSRFIHRIDLQHVSVSNVNTIIHFHVILTLSFGGAFRLNNLTAAQVDYHFFSLNRQAFDSLWIPPWQLYVLSLSDQWSLEVEPLMPVRPKVRFQTTWDTGAYAVRGSICSKCCHLARFGHSKSILWRILSDVNIEITYIFSSSLELKLEHGTHKNMSVLNPRRVKQRCT